MRNPLREALYWTWWLNGHLGSTRPASGPERLTVLIPAYHEKRSRNIAPLVRASLQCGSVDRVVISNHNPATSLASMVPTRDPRVTLIEEGVRRGCGHIWNVIGHQPGEFFLVIDDDQLLYPKQIAALFAALVADPESPHGLCGGRAGGVYLERCEADVEVLFNVYAVTRGHVDRFHELSQRLIATGEVRAEEIEHRCDDLVISRCGSTPARIHDAGFLLRCRTGGMEGVAIFKEPGFEDARARVEQALTFRR